MTHRIVLTEARHVMIGSLDGVGARCTCGDEIRRDLAVDWMQHDLTEAETAVFRWVAEHLQPRTTGHTLQPTEHGARCTCGDRYVVTDPNGTDDTPVVMWVARHLMGVQ